MKTLMTEADGGKSDEPENPVRLGELLLAEGLLTPAQLEETLLLLLLTMDDPTHTRLVYDVERSAGVKTG